MLQSRDLWAFLLNLSVCHLDASDNHFVQIHMVKEEWLAQIHRSRGCGSLDDQGEPLTTFQLQLQGVFLDSPRERTRLTPLADRNRFDQSSFPCMDVNVVFSRGHSRF